MDSNFDPELIPYELFIQYFTEDQNHLIQVFDPESPMRSVFRFGKALTRTVKKKCCTDTSKDESLNGSVNEIVDEVLRESMLNPATMCFLSDDM